MDSILILQDAPFSRLDSYGKTGIALRFIAAEFPSARMDEKLIDVYAVATFFFAAGGVFCWKRGLSEI